MSDQLRALGIELIEGYGADQMALKPDMFVIGKPAASGRGWAALPRRQRLRHDHAGEQQRQRQAGTSDGGDQRQMAGTDLRRQAALSGAPVSTPVSGAGGAQANGAEPRSDPQRQGGESAPD